jgi:hypothetical protein
VHPGNCELRAAGWGMASGGGYHRVSAAMQAALDRAGIKLDKRIDGVGDRAMEDALRAIAAYLGYASVHVVHI